MDDPSAKRLIDRHLVPVKPVLFNDFPCPDCGTERPEPKGTVWPGIHVFGSYRCTKCGSEFLRDLPVGFAVDHPIAISKSTGKLYNPAGAESWVHVPLIRAYRDQREQSVTIERLVKKHHRRVVILNTLDFLYGHVLLKLFNSPDYLRTYPDMGLVIMVPRMYAWLIPDGIAEAWIVDLKLGEMDGWYTSIDRFVQERLCEYDEVRMARGYAHPDMVPADMAQFTRVRPFDLEQFSSKNKHVTFVIREDRLWYKNGTVKFIHRVLRKLGLAQLLKGIFIRGQERSVAGCMDILRRELPGVTFSIVGLGRARNRALDVEDLRAARMDTVSERTWCEAYARSQVVVGVHGSNMLLPTSLAVGCVEILPYDRYGNMVQDFVVRHADRMQLFLYRFVDEFASPKAVARNVFTIFRDFEHFKRGMKTNTF